MVSYLTTAESKPWFSLASNVKKLASLRFVRDRCATDIGQLARFLVLLADNTNELFVGVTDWGMWGLGQDYRLFKLVRAGLGESRDIIDVPGHVARSLQDRIDLHFLVTVMLFAEWDFVLIGNGGDVVVKCTHHMEILAYAGEQRFLDALTDFMGNKPIRHPDWGYQSEPWPGDF